MTLHTKKKKKGGGWGDGEASTTQQGRLEFTLRLPHNSWLEQKPEVAVILP